MVYQCSYCNTGVMNTSDQYLVHIKSVKHKKKAFQLQAPYAGVEYVEFRPNVAPIAQNFVAVNEDFPQLSENIPTIGTPTLIQYGNIVGNFGAPSSALLTEMNGHRDVTANVVEQVSASLDDVFLKDYSNTVSAKHILGHYLKQNKTHGSALNEVAVAMGWKLEFEPAPASDNEFGFLVLIDSVELAHGQGESKKDARQNAAHEAIKLIRKQFAMERQRNASETLPSNSVAQSNNCAYRGPNLPGSSNNKNQRNAIQENYPVNDYCKLTIDKLIEIEALPNNKFIIPRRYSAFIITETPDQLAKDGVVVAFGAGSGVLKKNQQILEHPGFHITNFDSLVLARRSFQCFLYNQLSLLFDKNVPKNKFVKVYFVINKDGSVNLKNGCRVHLFMSHAPFGDCVESLPRNWTDPKQQPTKEMERDRKGILEPQMFVTYANNEHVKHPGHIRVLKDAKNDEWTSLVEFRDKMSLEPDFMVMSPTDKLMVWIHLGIQGAFLSHVMAPLYLYSVQVANDYMHEHFSRALMCRVPVEKLEDIADMSKYKDPYIGRVSKLPDAVQSLMGLSKQNVSYNWYSNSVTQMPEIIDCETGLVHRDSLYKLPDGDREFKCSRLTKVCMLMRLRNVFQLAIDYYAMRPELQRTRALQGIRDRAKHHYNLYKTSAVKYRSMKQCLFQALHDKGYGDWAPNNSANNFDLLQFYDL